MSAVSEYGEWRDRAKCKSADGELFFPMTKAWRVPEEVLKEFCDVCPVAGDCLSYALRSGQQFGVWGGTTPDQRAALRRKGVRRMCSRCGGETLHQGQVGPYTQKVKYGVCLHCGASWRTQ